MTSQIVITTDYLRPGDSVDHFLRDHGFEPTYSPAQLPRTQEEQDSLLSTAVAAIVASEPITRRMLTRAKNLRVIARSGVGYDAIDTAAASGLGIRVCNTPGVNHHAVAELALALMLNSARGLTAVLHNVEQGQWPREAGTELRGKALGIIGYGPSGQALATLGLALGMNVIASTRYPDRDTQPSIEFADLEKTISTADYLSLHARAGAAGPLIGSAAFDRMKNSAVLINTARGSLIDEEALLTALNTNQIAGAALDVLQEEPPSPDHPLRHHKNVSITSHLAGQTREARERAGIASAQSIIDTLRGKTPHGLIV